MDEVTGLSEKVIVEPRTKEELQPRIFIKDAAGTTVFKSRSRWEPTYSQQTARRSRAGDAIAKIPRETTKTKDITGGLPRVAELFEARKPKDPAIISEIDGSVEYGGMPKGMRRLLIRGEGGDAKEYLLPRGKHVTVLEGDEVKAGDPLMDGPINPHDILHVKGVEALQNYLVNEVQEVYRLQGVSINDKHIEVIVRQMLRRVRIESVGRHQLPGRGARGQGRSSRTRTAACGRRADGRRRRSRCSWASPRPRSRTESFLSAASFQETTRVLTEASINGARDELRGLKENVIIGRLIPAGTGMRWYRETRIATPEAPPPAARDGGGRGPGDGRGDLAGDGRESLVNSEKPLDKPGGPT